MKKVFKMFIRVAMVKMIIISILAFLLENCLLSAKIFPYTIKKILNNCKNSKK